MNPAARSPWATIAARPMSVACHAALGRIHPTQSGRLTSAELLQREPLAGLRGGNMEGIPIR